MCLYNICVYINICMCIYVEREIEEITKQIWQTVNYCWIWRQHIQRKRLYLQQFNELQTFKQMDVSMNSKQLPCAHHWPWIVSGRSSGFFLNFLNSCSRGNCVFIFTVRYEEIERGHGRVLDLNSDHTYFLPQQERTVHGCQTGRGAAPACRSSRPTGRA